MKTIFEILSNYRLHFLSSVPNDLKCIICRSAVIDSCLSVCGCRLCWDCHEAYLDDDGKLCPGSNILCNSTFINLPENVQRDPLGNSQVSLLFVNCPYENCDCNCQLKDLPEHMEVCGNAPPTCVFSDIGCDESLQVCHSMGKHLKQRNVQHARILVDYIKNLEYQMTQKIEGIASALESQTNLIEGLTEENKKLNSKLHRSENHVLMLQQRLEQSEIQHTAANMQINVLQRQLDEKDGEILRVQDEQGSVKSEMTGVLQKVENLASEESQWQQQMEGSMTKLRKANLKGKRSMKTMKRRLIEKLGSGDIPTELVATNNAFEWRIEKINEKCSCGRVEWSDPFFSDGPNKGYKMRLEYHMSKRSGLWLVFYLMYGPNDDRLQWPMRRTVQLDVIDQLWKVPAISRLVCLASVEDRKEASPEAYSKPGSENRCGDGYTDRYIMYNDILLSSVVTNDVMLVRCKMLPH